MDFVARAGRLLDKAYRVAGILVLILAVQTSYSLYLSQQNKELNLKYEELRETAKIYVVPGGQPGWYSPERLEVLLQQFITLIVQSRLTYTPASLEPQFLEIRRYLDPRMLARADAEFVDLKKMADLDERASLFVPDMTTFAVKNTGRRMGGRDEKQVTLEGNLNFIIGGRVVDEQRVEVTLTVQPTNISKTNPFGYILISYREKALDQKRR